MKSDKRKAGIWFVKLEVLIDLANYLITNVWLCASIRLMINQAGYWPIRFKEIEKLLINIHIVHHSTSPGNSDEEGICYSEENIHEVCQPNVCCMGWDVENKCICYGNNRKAQFTKQRPVDPHEPQREGHTCSNQVRNSSDTSIVDFVMLWWEDHIPEVLCIIFNLEFPTRSEGPPKWPDEQLLLGVAYLEIMPQVYQTLFPG